MKFMRPEDLHLAARGSGRTCSSGCVPCSKPRPASTTWTCALDVPADLPAVEGDPEPARAGVPEPRAERVPGDARRRPAAHRARGRRGRLVAIDVEDTGVGIAPENLSRIFDLYFTTKPSGSGIGLSLVFRTVQLHDGDIEVQSTPGRGTTFRVQLKQAARMFESVGG